MKILVSSSATEPRAILPLMGLLMASFEDLWEDISQRRSRPRRRPAWKLWSPAVALACVLCGWTAPGMAAGQVIRYFPSGEIYEYRWKLLELALAHGQEGQEPFRLLPYAEDITQNRGLSLLQSGEIDVVALGTNPAREASARPIRIDILRGIIGFRVFLIRASDQARITPMDDTTLRQQLIFGLERDWADLPIMLANGFKVETTSGYENLFAMLDAGHFDAFPRGLNEVYRDLAQYQKTYPRLALEQTKALYFPFPIYFCVNKNNTVLAQKIERGLTLASKDGSFRKLFTTYYAEEITLMRKHPRHVLRLANPNLPAGAAEPETAWWWKQH